MLQNVELFLRSYGRRPGTFTFRDVLERCRRIGISSRWFKVADMKTKRSELLKEVMSLATSSKTGKIQSAPRNYTPPAVEDLSV